MRIPPLMARVEIGRGPHPLAFWFPVVLLWLPLLLLLLPFLLLGWVVALATLWRWSFLGLGRGLWVALCETRGASVAFHGARARFSIALH